MTKLRLFAVAASGIWIAYLIYLDMKYQKFPEVLIGGLKILVAVYFISFLGYVGSIVIRKIFRREKGQVASIHSNPDSKK